MVPWLPMAAHGAHCITDGVNMRVAAADHVFRPSEAVAMSAPLSSPLDALPRGHTPGSAGRQLLTLAAEDMELSTAPPPRRGGLSCSGS